MHKKLYILLTKSEVLIVCESCWYGDTWRASTKVHSTNIIQYGVLFTEFHVSLRFYKACHLTNVIRGKEENKGVW